MEKPDILSLTLEELTQQVKDGKQQAFRGAQTFSWLHEKKVSSFSEMTNLSKDLRLWLEENYSLPCFSVKRKQVSTLDGTIKYLFELPDGNCIETVQMEYEHGTSLCVSTQVGCRMGCGFCASTLGGLVRNLTTAEILRQVYTVESLSNKRVSHIVLMGIGEPLDNFENIVDFLRIVSHPKGKNLSLRNITLSTCGIVEKIDALAELKMPITLAISLHASNDKRRSEIMPINRKWNIKQLIAACKRYFKATGRRITFEYALIDGVNDSTKDADELANLLKGMPVHVNLIPVNPVVEKSFQQSQTKAIHAFAQQLTARGVTTTVRRELGRDISAACGQLRHENSL